MNLERKIHQNLIYGLIEVDRQISALSSLSTSLHEGVIAHKHFSKILKVKFNVMAIKDMAGLLVTSINPAVVVSNMLDENLQMLLKSIIKIVWRNKH